LTAANTRVHGEIDEALLRVLEAATALDADGLRESWSRFVSLHEVHVAFEEGEVFPLYAGLDAHPRGGGPDLFVADHVSLGKVAAAAADALGAILDAGAGRLGRRVMVKHLGPLIRLRNVLEHHTLREERFLYPRLEATLGAEEIAALVEGITAGTGSRPSDRSRG